jgi:hypothetical protein
MGPERRNRVWSYNFVETKTHDGRTLRRECLAIRVVCRINGFGDARFVHRWHAREVPGLCLCFHFARPGLRFHRIQFSSKSPIQYKFAMGLNLSS